MANKTFASLDKNVASKTGAGRELVYELISGGTGLLLALFMWGHVILVGSILTGERGFDWMATMLEDYYIAQPTVAAIFTMFLVHAAFAARKIPSQLRERRRMLELARGLKNSESPPSKPPAYSIDTEFRIPCVGSILLSRRSTA